MFLGVLSIKYLKGLPAVVIVLGLASLFNDVSSEMIYPLLPVFLVKHLGAGAAFLGVVEGVADATASMMNLFAGLWTDRLKDRSRFVLSGYTLASGARSLLALAPNPLSVLVLRFLDRVGKGLRTSPRNAIIAESVEADRRGQAFGFHRAMDNTGAVLGPLIAAALIACGFSRFRLIFALAAVPATIAILLVALKVREPEGARAPEAAKPNLLEAPARSLRPYLAVLFLFGLSQSTDAFLLLRAADLGLPTAQIPLLWSAFHLVKIFFGLHFSQMSDRLGRRPIIAAGWVVYALAYVGFALAKNAIHVWLLFLFYGVFYGLTEGPERALLADLAGPGRKGAAFGWYNFTSGLALLLASVLFGAVWQAAGPAAAFAAGAGIALAAAGSFLLIDLPDPA